MEKLSEKQGKIVFLSHFFLPLSFSHFRAFLSSSEDLMKLLVNPLGIYFSQGSINHDYSTLISSRKPGRISEGKRLFCRSFQWSELSTLSFNEICRHTFKNFLTQALEFSIPRLSCRTIFPRKKPKRKEKKEEKDRRRKRAQFSPSNSLSVLFPIHHTKGDIFLLPPPAMQRGRQIDGAYFSWV